MKGFRLIGCEGGQIRLSGELYGLGAEGGDVDAAGEGGDVEGGAGGGDEVTEDCFSIGGEDGKEALSVAYDYRVSVHENVRCYRRYSINSRSCAGLGVEVGKSLLLSEFFANFAHKYLRK